MSVKGPQDITFLFPKRLEALAEKSSKKPASILDLDSIDNLMVPTSSHSARVESAVTLEQRPSFIDFLIEKAGYPINTDSSTTVRDQYQIHFEKIIHEQGGVFETLFLTIKDKLDKNPDAKSLEEEKRTAAIKLAREQALKDLGDTLKELGAYHIDDSKYYFSENELVKSLSGPFLKALYGDPKRAHAMLQSQKEKTEGQYQGKLEYIRENFLPGTYYGEVEDLSPLQDDFDLFLASPTIADIFNRIEKKKNVAAKPSLYESRADLLEGVHDVLHAAYRSTLNRKANRLDWFRATKKPEALTDYPTFDDILTQAFGRLTIKEVATQLPKDFVKAQTTPFKSYLEKHDFNFVTFESLNAVEQVFFFKYYMNQYINADLKKDINTINGEIESLQEKYNQRKEAVIKEYLKTNHDGKTLKELQPILKAKMREVMEKIDTAVKTDPQIILVSKALEQKNVELQLTKKTATEQLEKVNQVKATFVDTYYPQVKPVAKELATAFRALSKEKQSAKQGYEEGGNFSCLSFIPVKISETGKSDRFECLIALSGAELEATTGINPHQVLKEFAQTFKAPGFEKFTFRYVEESAGYLNLLLKQLGKGLSGSAEPLSSRKHDGVLPEFEKACAEKRLTQALVELYALYGSQVQVLGCDNIALPLSKQASEEKQKAFHEREKKKLEELKKKQEALKKKQALSKKATTDSSKESITTEATATENESDNKPVFTFEAKYPGNASEVSKTITLEAEHITCCSSCQAQKPAVMTFLYDGMKRADSRLREQASMLKATKHSASDPHTCKDKLPLVENVVANSKLEMRVFS